LASASTVMPVVQMAFANFAVRFCCSRGEARGDAGGSTCLPLPLSTRGVAGTAGSGAGCGSGSVFGSVATFLPRLLPAAAGSGAGGTGSTAAAALRFFVAVDELPPTYATRNNFFFYLYKIS